MVAAFASKNIERVYLPAPVKAPEKTCRPKEAPRGNRPVVRYHSSSNYLAAELSNPAYRSARYSTPGTINYLTCSPPMLPLVYINTAPFDSWQCTCSHHQHLPFYCCLLSILKLSPKQNLLSQGRGKVKPSLLQQRNEPWRPHEQPSAPAWANVHTAWSRTDGMARTKHLLCA